MKPPVLIMQIVIGLIGLPSELLIRNLPFIIIRAGNTDQAHETTCSADSPRRLKSRAVDEKSEV
ncbi:hypothetical protein MtrunA17_Chr4g0023711 [Medicago truncatula]|uniref:Uncharacterized protein n=1 Tax=Medicago truncatula TaxID=3880 RepID=A0A396IBQ7_MEDTR|nr:hypothetical protein MtrunA17_Chr4g0023711 [Medicago truncatula]